MARFAPIFLLLGTCLLRAELVWEQTAQEFQRRSEDRELAVTFVFRNEGKLPITVTKVTSSCGCATAELPKKTFAPGESGTLTSKFTFGGRRGMQAKTIAVTTDDGKVAQLSFQCLIADEPVTVSPALVWWRVGEPAEAKKIDIAVAQNPAIKITAAASTNPRIAAALTTVKEGEKYALTVKPTDTVQAESGQVFIQTNFPPEGPKAYTVHVRVK